MYDLAALIAIIRRRWRTALGLFIAIFVVGAVIVFLYPRTYVASSQVLVKQPNAPQVATAYPQIDALLTWSADTTMETYIALARQPAIAESVIRQLGLKVGETSLLSRYVVVTPLTNSNIIDISVDWRDPTGAANIANAFAGAFIAQQRTLAASQASAAAASLSIALGKAQGDLSKAENDLTLFESRRGLADATGQTSTLLSAIADIQSKERAAEAARAQAQAQLSSIGSQMTGVQPTVEQSKTIETVPIVDQIDQQLAQQQLQLRQLRQQFTERYPDVQALQKQIANLQGALARMPKTRVASTTIAQNPFGLTLNTQAATLQAQVAGSSAELATLRSQAGSLLAQLRLFPAGISELSNLQRRVKGAETIYDALQNNYFNAVIAKSMAVSDLSIVRRASPALASVRPSIPFAMLVVLLIALFAALLGVALIEWVVEPSLSESDLFAAR